MLKIASLTVPFSTASFSNFMIQGGGMTEDMQQKPTKATIENEAKNGLKNKQYSVAMARTIGSSFCKLSVFY